MSRASTMHARVSAAVLAGTGLGLGPADRAEVEDYVLGRIAAAPAHLRLGVDAVALTLSPLGQGSVPLDRWTSSRLVPVRRYVQLIRALTLFAAYERAAPLGPGE